MQAKLRPQGRRHKTDLAKVLQSTRARGVQRESKKNAALRLLVAIARVEPLLPALLAAADQMAAVTSTPSKGGLQLRLGGRELPVSPPTSPGFDDDDSAKAVRPGAATAIAECHPAAH